MQPVLAMRPELERLRNDPVAAPEVRQRDGARPRSGLRPPRSGRPAPPGRRAARTAATPRRRSGCRAAGSPSRRRRRSGSTSSTRPSTRTCRPSSGQWKTSAACGFSESSSALARPSVREEEEPVARRARAGAPCAPKGGRRAWPSPASSRRRAVRPRRLEASRGARRSGSGSRSWRSTSAEDACAVRRAA